MAMAESGRVQSVFPQRSHHGTSSGNAVDKEQFDNAFTTLSEALSKNIKCFSCVAFLILLCLVAAVAGVIVLSEMEMSGLNEKMKNDSVNCNNRIDKFKSDEDAEEEKEREERNNLRIRLENATVLLREGNITMETLKNITSALVEDNRYLRTKLKDNMASLQKQNENLKNTTTLLQRENNDTKAQLENITKELEKSRASNKAENNRLSEEVANLRKEVKRELEVKVNEEVAKKLAEIKSNIRSLRKDSDDFDD